MLFLNLFPESLEFIKYLLLFSVDGACLNQGLIKKWKRMIRREANEATKRGELFDPSTKLEVKFLRNLIEEFLEVLSYNKL